MPGSSQPERVRPPALRAGDTVGIVAPAGPIQPEALEAGCSRLRALGYNPVYSDSVLERDMYFAGSVRRRVRELHEMFERRDVRAVLCGRGGYGSNYLLPHLDLPLIRANPKIFAGCSDVTALLTYLCDAARMVVFHSPMAAGDFARSEGVDVDSWRAAVTSGATYQRQFSTDEVAPLAPGEAEGILYGGCLSLLCASLGTPYEIRTENAILFVEDVNEPTYRIDRMLMQLKLAGKLEGVRGIIFGEMLNCGPAPGHTLQHVVMRVLEDVPVPVAYGLRAGHVSGGNITLPLGLQASLVVGNDVTLRYEAAVSQPPATAPVANS